MQPPRPTAVPAQAAPLSLPLSLPPGQRLSNNLPARTVIVALQGGLRLAVRPHALAWLGTDAAVISIDLQEGARHVLADHATVCITAAHGGGARLAVQLPKPLARRACKATLDVLAAWRQRLCTVARRAVAASRPAR